MLKPFYQSHGEAGTDEAGRGCLAGPVTAAAVILPPGYSNPALNDSKKLTARDRAALAIEIKAEALSYAIADISPERIDALNILQASILGMHEALKELQLNPSAILVDGNRFKPYSDIPYYCMIKGDGRFMSIAAASILAKTHRDALMANLHLGHPHYNWKQNKGYPTPEHRDAIRIFGPTEHHRKTFRLLPEQLKLNF